MPIEKIAGDSMGTDAIFYRTDDVKEIELRACLVINVPSDSEMIFCPARRMEAQILCVSKLTTTKQGGKSAGMLGTDIARQALRINLICGVQRISM